MEMQWFDSVENVINLARALESNTDLRSVDQVIRLFEKPWKWEKEWGLFQESVKNGVSYGEYLDYLDEMEYQAAMAESE
ncbi:MAG: hypothetical protein ACO3F3_15960 [Gemmataceae bacterium]